MHWQMIQVKFVPLSMKDVTGSIHSFARACPTSRIEKFIMFLLSGHNIWLRRCSIVADILYLFERRPMKFSKNFVQSL